MTIKGKLNLIFDRTLTIPSIVKKKKNPDHFPKTKCQEQAFPQWILSPRIMLLGPNSR